MRRRIMIQNQLLSEVSSKTRGSGAQSPSVAVAGNAWGAIAGLVSTQRKEVVARGATDKAPSSKPDTWLRETVPGCPEIAISPLLHIPLLPITALSSSHHHHRHCHVHQVCASQPPTDPTIIWAGGGARSERGGAILPATSAGKLPQWFIRSDMRGDREGECCHGPVDLFGFLRD